MINWPCCFGPVARQHIVAGICDRAKLFTKLAKKQRKEEEETRVPQSSGRVYSQGPKDFVLTLKIPPPLRSTKLESEPLTRDPLETFQIQTTAKSLSSPVRRVRIRKNKDNPYSLQTL
jgi:predicted secreted protein